MNTKKRILLILPGFNFGGTVFSTLNMISFLSKDYDVTVLPMTFQGPILNNYRQYGVKLFPESLLLSGFTCNLDKMKIGWKKWLFSSIKIIRRLLRYCGIDYEYIVYKSKARKIERKYDFDYVASCQEGSATYFASCFQKAKRIAWFRSEYSVYKEECSDNTLIKEKRLYPLFDNIVCVSLTTRNDFVSFFPALSDKVFPIHNIQNVGDIEAKSKEYVSDMPMNVFTIVSVGRMNPQKRFSFIPSIARKLLDTGCSFKWIIIGDGNVFGEWDKLQKEITNNHVEDTVLCLGGKVNPYPYIKCSDLLVNTSYVEACPRVVIEAKLLKTPVICADFSSAREFVTSDVDGYVDTIDKIHTHIAKMILDKKYYSKIKTTCETYSIDNDHIYSQLKDIFK